MSQSPMPVEKFNLYYDPVTDEPWVFTPWNEAIPALRFIDGMELALGESTAYERIYVRRILERMNESLDEAIAEKEGVGV